MDPKIDVIVPWFGKAKLTCEFLESFAKYRLDGMRLILVDNGSAAYEVAEVGAAIHTLDIPTLNVRLSENTGFVRGTNAGLAVSTAPFVLLQNNDTRVYQQTYVRLLAALLSSDKIGLVGPVASECSSWQSIQQLYKEKPFVDALQKCEILTVPSDDRPRLLASHLGGIRRPVGNMVAFFCTLIRREVVDKIGYLSNAYGQGFGDDDDYCARARRAGFEITLACDSYVHHHHRSTWNAIYTPAEITEMKRKNLDILRKNWPTT